MRTWYPRARIRLFLHNLAAILDRYKRSEVSGISPRISSKMSTRSQRNKDNKQVTNQAILVEMLREEKNKYCADCGAKGPRWASWNLGVFMCIRCAGIHRNLGVHISKVKSVNLDTWTDEQMASIQDWGNRRAGLYWECYLPEDFRRPQTDSAMEAFIRKKYEQKKFIKKDGPPPKGTSSAVPVKAKPVEKEVKRKKKEEGNNVISLTAVQKTASKVSQPPVSTATAVSRPKPHAQPAAAPAQVAKPRLPSVDLLSLGTPAPVMSEVSSQPKPAPQSSLEAELIDFGAFQGVPTPDFSQSPPQKNHQLAGMTAQTSVDNGESLLKDDTPVNKSAKDSIMALYTPSPAAQQPQMFGVPGGMYISPQQQQQQQPPPQNMFNRQMANPYPQQAMPMHMQQPHPPNMMQQQQVQHVANIQHQMQNLRLQQHQQMPQQRQQMPPQCQQMPQQHQQMPQRQQMPQQQQMQQQQPNMYGNQNMFAPQQTMNALMMQQQSMHCQQQMQPQFISTGPSNNMVPNNMYPMGGGASTGHTLSTQLWK